MCDLMKSIYIILCISALAALLGACASDAVDPSGNTNNGVGGSLARFAISGNHLYTVDFHSLSVFDVSDAANPGKANHLDVGVNIETIFPKEKTLFIGSQEGMYIYDITSPAQPAFLSVFTHVVSCDPVVADDRYAYVTLRSVNGFCGRFTNQLDIIDIQNLRNPFLVTSYGMNSPKGLGIDGNTLFLCDDGLKVYDVSDANNLDLKYHFFIEANDVIPYQGNLMVIGADGLYQYDYTGDTVIFASKIPIIPIL